MPPHLHEVRQLRRLVLRHRRHIGLRGRARGRSGARHAIAARKQLRRKTDSGDDQAHGTHTRGQTVTRRLSIHDMHPRPHASTGTLAS